MNFKIGLFIYIKAPARSVIGNIMNVYISWMITDILTIASLWIQEPGIYFWLFGHVRVQSLSRVLLSCDPMDCILPDSSVHGISQARVLEWVAIFSFFRDLPDSGIKPTSPVLPALAVGFFTIAPNGKPCFGLL